MQTGQITTPFGRRPMTLALVKGQLQSAEQTPKRPLEKWKVFRDVAEARRTLGLQDRAVAVLDALLTFYPHNELKPDASLVVFPSNAQLSIRAHGITGTTLRRHLAALVDAGLIHRRDSPNGKRYAHRDQAGEIDTAFGFDLEPLLRRAAEIAGMAQQVAAELRLFKRTKEALTLCRRDVRKLITAAIEEGAEGNWTQIESIYIATLATLPRSPTRQQMEATLDEMTLLREEIINQLNAQVNPLETDGNADHNGCHIQSSNTESSNELEPGFETKQGANPSKTIGPNAEPPKAFPLGMVLRACPTIADYAPGGAIANWRDLMSAAVVVRSMLGVSPSAYQDACEAMGPENAAVTMAGILERAGQINSAGGYLRSLTARAQRGEFSLGPLIMALLRAGGETQTRTG
jgi:replication initiation protein RepC